MAFDPKVAVSNWNAALENLNAQINSDDPIEKRLDHINDIVNELANDRFDVNPQAHQRIIELQGEVNQLTAQTSISKEQEADILSKLRNVYKIGKVAEAQLPSKPSPAQASKKEDAIASILTDLLGDTPDVDIGKAMEQAKKGDVEAADDNAKAVMERSEEMREIQGIFDEFSTSYKLDTIANQVDNYKSIYVELKTKLASLEYNQAFLDEFPETSKLITALIDSDKPGPPGSQRNMAEIRTKLNEIYESYKTEQSPHISENIKLWEYLFHQILDRPPSGSYETQLKDIRLPLRQLLDFTSFRKDLPSIYDKIQSIYAEVESALKPDPSQYGPPPSIQSILQKIQKAYNEYNSLKETAVTTILPRDVLGIIAGQAVGAKGGSQAVTQMDRLGFSTAFARTAKDARTTAEYLSEYAGLKHLDLNLLKRAGKELHKLDFGFTPSPTDLEQIKQVCPNIRSIRFSYGTDLTDQTLLKIAQLFPDLEEIRLPSDVSNISDEAFKQFFSQCKNIIEVDSSEMPPRLLNIIAENCPDLHNFTPFEFSEFSDKTVANLLKFKFIKHLFLSETENISEAQLKTLLSQPLINLEHLNLNIKPSKELLSLIAKNCPRLEGIILSHLDTFNEDDQKMYADLLPGVKYILVLSKDIKTLYNKTPAADE